MRSIYAFVCSFSLAALTIGGCTPTIPEGAFVCSTNDPCPPGFSCGADGICRRGPAADVGALDTGFDGPNLDGNTFDGGVVDAGLDAGELDGGPDADLVIVSGTVTHVLEGSTMPEPITFDPTLELRIVTGPTSVSAPIMPITVAPGVRGFAGVPHGMTYYLRTAPTVFRIDTARSIDLSSYSMGRPSATNATSSSTVVTFDITALDAWQSGDIIELVAPNANDYFFLNDGDVTPGPNVGDVALSGYAVPWIGNPLVLGAMGDVLTIFHASTVSAGGAFRARVVRERCVFPRFDMTDGTPSMLSGAFTNVPADAAMTITNWRTTAFEAMRSQLGPGLGSAPGHHTMDVQAQPLRPPHATQFSGTLDLYFVDGDPSADVSLGTFHYANPYAASDVLRGTQVYFDTTVQVPGAMPTTFGFGIQSASVGMFEEEGAGFSPTLSPPVTPATGIMVNGIALSSPGAYPDVRVDQPVVVSFTPSAGGMPPREYVFRIFEGFMGPMGGTRLVQAATIRVAAGVTTDFMLPAGLLEPGKYYRMTVGAAAGDPAGPVLQAWAIAGTSFFHTTSGAPSADAGVDGG
jgi:hypothetical protein